MAPTWTGCSTGLHLVLNIYDKWVREAPENKDRTLQTERRRNRRRTDNPTDGRDHWKNKAECSRRHQRSSELVNKDTYQDHSVNLSLPTNRTG